MSRLERLLESAARKFSGGLHPMEILARVDEAFDVAARDGQAPNMIRVVFNPGDYAQYRPSLPALRAEIVDRLERRERAAGLARFGERMVSFESSDREPAGLPRVIATFADTRQRDFAPPRGATMRLARHRGVTLAFEDGTQAPLTHTPFTIGRGPENDLAIPSLAVSRRHAEISSANGHFAIRDLASRNGVFVNGKRTESSPLEPGDRVLLGDTEFSFEAPP